MIQIVHPMEMIRLLQLLYLYVKQNPAIEKKMMMEDIYVNDATTKVQTNIRTHIPG